MSDPRRGRFKLLLLAALFFAPVAGAIAVYVWAPEWFSGRINHGTLVSPARAVPELGLADADGAAAPAALAAGRWSLVYLGAAACDAACEQRLALTRQVRLALNQNRGRVQRVYLAPDAAALARARSQLAPEHPDLLFFAQSGARAAGFFEPADPHAVYLLDPFGNWLMTYSGTIEHRGLHRDLKKLLRVSRVG